MIKREIEICGKKIPFRSSATIPRLYRAKFKRDIFKDLSKLEKSYVGTQKDGAEFQIDDLEIFENVAYIMAYHADNSIPLICFLFMRCYHKFWNYGETMWLRISKQKKAWQK